MEIGLDDALRRIDEYAIAGSGGQISNHSVRLYREAEPLLSREPALLAPIENAQRGAIRERSRSKSRRRRRSLLRRGTPSDVVPSAHR